MTASFEQFKRIVEYYLPVCNLYNNLLNDYPENYATCILEDPYVEKLQKFYENILETVLPEHHCECLFWFMYEWKPGLEITTYEQDGSEKVYIINDVNDYLAFKEKTWS